MLLLKWMKHSFEREDYYFMKSNVRCMQLWQWRHTIFNVNVLGIEFWNQVANVARLKPSKNVLCSKIKICSFATVFWFYLAEAFTHVNHLGW